MYQYRYRGKKGQKFQLTEAKDLVVVRTKTDKDLKETELSATSKRLVPKMLKIGGFPEANVSVYRCIDRQRNNAMKLRNEVRRNFRQEKNIRFAGRVLKDAKSGEVVIYTENFFVKFKDNTTSPKCEQIIKELGLRIKEKLDFATNAYFVVAPKRTGLKIFELAETLLTNKLVEYCHPELVRQKKHRSIYEQQWHLKPLLKNGTLIEQHINVEEAWQTTRGEGVIIAVIDDGVDENHEEFAGKIIMPFDAVNNVNDANPKYNDANHGTACAGVACAAGRNKASGVAPEAQLMPICSGGLGSLAEAKAFSWAADNGADVISCSWGPYDGDPWNSEDPQHFMDFPLPDSTRLAIDYAIQNGRSGKGCIITWAAGNGNESVDLDGYASYSKVIAVAASNDRGVRSSYSDYGDAVWCCFPSKDFRTDFSPPPLTTGIWTTDRVGRLGYNRGYELYGDVEGNYTNDFGGTSSACPGVAGVIALMLGANPDLNWQEVKTIIKYSCDKIDKDFGDYDANGHSLLYGYGKINAAKAVANALKAKDLETEEYMLNGVAHFSKLSDVAILEGVTQQDLPDKSRLLAFSLEIVPFHPCLSLKYRTIINKLGTTEWSDAGEVNGTTDKRRKIIGFIIQLTGQLANQYDIHYQGESKKGTILLEGKNGSICGTAKNGSPAIENIKIQIVKK